MPTSVGFVLGFVTVAISVTALAGWYIVRSTRKRTVAEIRQDQAEAQAKEERRIQVEWDRISAERRKLDEADKNLSPADKLTNAGKRITSGFLLLSLLFAGCSYNLRLSRAPVPARPEWCEYKAVNQKGGVWLSKTDNDSLALNIRNLQEYCAKLESSLGVKRGK